MIIDINDLVLQQGIEALHYETDPRVKRLISALRYGIVKELAMQTAFEADLRFEKDFWLTPEDTEDDIIMCFDPKRIIPFYGERQRRGIF